VPQAPHEISLVVQANHSAAAARRALPRDLKFHTNKFSRFVNSTTKARGHEAHDRPCKTLNAAIEPIAIFAGSGFFTQDTFARPGTARVKLPGLLKRAGHAIEPSIVQEAPLCRTPHFLTRFSISIGPRMQAMTENDVPLRRIPTSAREWSTPSER
jgi:hypothetical protein